MCVFILCVTISEKFAEGGWVTLSVTTVCVLVCFWIRRYYRGVVARLQRLDETLESVAALEKLRQNAPRLTPNSDSRDPGRRVQRLGCSHAFERDPIRAESFSQHDFSIGRRGR